MRIAVAILTVLWGVGLATHADDEAPRDPRDVGLVERSGTRLAQVDITVMGPPEVIRDLTPADFRIRVQLTPIEDFALDRYCDPAPLDGAAVADVAGAASGVHPPATFLFYTDQIFLTLEGRQNAITLARQMIRRLIQDGNRGMLVSNAKELLVLQPLTDDAEVLLAAVDRLEKDRTQWHEYAALEESRVADLARALNDRRDLFAGAAAEVERAMGLARRYQVEETWRAEKSMRRLAMTLGRLTDEPAPKAAIFFADTLRQNAGAHYAAFFGSRPDLRAPLAEIESDGLKIRNVFDDIISEAAAQGIRFYPVLSQGLVNTDTGALPSLRAQNTMRTAQTGSRTRYNEVRDSMGNMAAETGGYAFINGQSAGRMIERIENDFSCLYIASFDPSSFREDQPLRIIVGTTRDDVTLRTRGRLVVQSESTRRTARLVNAFASSQDESQDDLLEVRTTIVPTGFRNGDFTALLQISLPPTPIQGATWDLGASIVTRDKVDTEASGRLEVPLPGLPVVLERELSFRPGSYEVISVAHEASSGLISSGQSAFEWPDPRKRPVTTSPVAVLQPAEGVFLRDGETRKSGSLARAADQALRTDRPTALVSLVCRGRKTKEPLVVERKLVGASEVDFPVVTHERLDETCAQIRDLVPANTLGEGYSRYQVTVLTGDERLEVADREFFAVDPLKH